MSITEALEARKTKANHTFDEWLAMLDAAALSNGFKGRIVKDTGSDCWRDYYLDGYTPTQALLEDLSNG